MIPPTANITIQFWDMDHTLIDNDCDVSWKEFLIGKGLAPGDAVGKNEFFWDQYKNGTLDQAAFIDFQLCEFKGKSVEEMARLAEEHFTRTVKPHIYTEAETMVKASVHKEDVPCLITATNSVIARPVAYWFGFEHVLATEPEICDSRYTGKIYGAYCGGKGKIPYMRAFCEKFETTILDCYYYGDSVVDIPIMEAVGHPVAINPMQELKEFAQKKGWPIINFVTGLGSEV